MFSREDDFKIFREYKIRIKLEESCYLIFELTYKATVIKMEWSWPRIDTDHR